MTAAPEHRVSIDRVYIHHMAPERFRDALRERLPGTELVCWRTEADFATGLPGAEVLMAFRPPRGQWRRADRLRFIQMTGAGVDALLPAPDLPARVRIANARGIHAEHMGEFALAMMLAFEKRIPLWLEEQRQRRWQYHGIRTLRGKTAAILGLGAIGLEVARLCRAFGMRVVGTRRSGAAAEGVHRVARPDETRELLAGADYVVILLPLTPETRGSVGAELLDGLPKHAVLINLARGGIVDELELAERLDAGRLRGAALDVFAEEPLPAASPLWTTPNTILTPHISGWFPGYAERVADIFIENLGRLARGEALRNEIDRGRGY